MSMVQLIKAVKAAHGAYVYGCPECCAIADALAEAEMKDAEWTRAREAWLSHENGWIDCVFGEDEFNILDQFFGGGEATE